ncbi:hypothetical protein ACSSS7_003209 [Eimeria intestinalis]
MVNSVMHAACGVCLLLHLSLFAAARLSPLRAVPQCRSPASVSPARLFFCESTWVRPAGSRSLKQQPAAAKRHDDSSSSGETNWTHPNNAISGTKDSDSSSSSNSKSNGNSRKEADSSSSSSEVGRLRQRDPSRTVRGDPRSRRSSSSPYTKRAAAAAAAAVGCTVMSHLILRKQQHLQGSLCQLSLHLLHARASRIFLTFFLPVELHTEKRRQQNSAQGD